ncbi:MAG TPA: histidine phosphatase family protein [Stellaceae bacterium]|nr:histidine phosphatase family protein [Stellaceae bacterium]
MTTILLVRHGHVEGIAPVRFRGRAELPLSDLGRRQAAALGHYIAANFKPEAVYTSPLSRCRDTGAAIAGHFALTRIAIDGLADIDYGAWQGLTPEEAARRWPREVATWQSRPHFVEIPGGESLAALSARATAALHGILMRQPAGTLALVGHESVNRILLLHALELPLSRYWHLGQEPCALNRLEFSNGGFLTHSINETQHLAGI